MSVPMRWVGPQVNKFEQVFSDDHQMSVVEREVGNYSTMDNSHMGFPPSDRQTPVKALPFFNFVCGR